MIELMSDLPEGVLGFTAVGKVTGSDYEQVLVPAVEAALKERDKIALVYHCGEQFTGFDAGAAWDDAKVGLKHITAWRRIAVVTDIGWMRTAVRAFGFALPCPVRVFDNAELASARSWAGETS
jgi:hypothetical protein